LRRIRGFGYEELQMDGGRYVWDLRQVEF
jgi:hypothetical protein